MKKILLTMIVALAGMIAIAQETPCPTVSGVRKVNEVNNGNGTCTAQVELTITNDVSDPNPKGVQVEVFCGPISGTPVLTQCFIGVAGTAVFTTNSFTCTCGSPLTIRITRFTASNGNCQGGTCGAVIIIQETPLPVNFKSFTAVRNGGNVNLRWETMTEQNNSGFAVERKTNGGWEQVGFVQSQAPNGSSSNLLVYNYTDANTFKGISQYRLRQIDFDNRSTTSEVKAVRGVNNKAQLLVYPNPSNNGIVNVVFEDGSAIRDVTLSDMAGRVVRQMKGISNNNIQFENLFPGVYSLRVVDRETGEQNVQKIVVNKR